MDTLDMNVIMLAIAVTLSIGVRLAVGEDHLPHSLGQGVRWLLTWGDAVLFALPIALLSGVQNGLFALLPYMVIALAVISTLRARELCSERCCVPELLPENQHSCASFDTNIAGSGSTVVAFRTKTTDDAPDANT